MKIFSGTGPLGLPGSLFTKEDPFNLHKTFGFAVLLHFIYRLALLPAGFWSGKDLMGFGVGRPETPWLLSLHSVLLLISFAFHIPAKRIKQGSRIWPQFRWHNTLFNHRSIAVMILLWLDQVYPAADGQPRYWGNVILVFLNLFATDLADASIPPQYRSQSVRELETGFGTKIFFTYNQFYGTTRMLIGARAYAGHFMGIFVSQMFAFSLTLQRKNLVEHRTTVIFYAAEIVLYLIVSGAEFALLGGAAGLCMVLSLAALANALRVNLGLHKYAVWAVTAVAVQYARATTIYVPAAHRIAEWDTWQWPAILALLLVWVIIGRPKRSPTSSSSAPNSDKQPASSGSETSSASKGKGEE